MGLSFNPADLVKILIERRHLTKTEALDWLETVRAEARDLSQVWLQIADEFNTMDEVRIEGSDKEFGRLFRMNAVLGYRLQEFYNLTTIAVGKSLRETTHDGFASKLGKVLNNRMVTRKSALKVLADMKNERRFFIEEANRNASLETIQDSAAVLQRELAALDAFIQTIKASPTAFR